MRNKNRAAVNPLAPEPGYYLLRFVRKGWQVPCLITLENGRYSAVINGEPMPGSYAPDDMMHMMHNWVTSPETHPMVRLILYGERCSEDEYNLRTEQRRWALAHDLRHPAANPYTPIDLAQAAPVEF